MGMGKRTSGRVKIIHVVCTKPRIGIDFGYSAYVIKAGGEVIGDDGGRELRKVEPMPRREDGDRAVLRIWRQVREQNGFAHANAAGSRDVRGDPGRQFANAVGAEWAVRIRCPEWRKRGIRARLQLDPLGNSRRNTKERIKPNLQLAL